MICQSKQLQRTPCSVSFPPLNTSDVKRRKATKMQSEKCRYLFISLLAFRWQQKTLKTTNERHLQVAPTPVPLLQRLELACAALFVSSSASAPASSCLHLLSDFVVVVAIHTPKLLLLHECCKSKVGESHEGSKTAAPAPAPTPSPSPSPAAAFAVQAPSDGGPGPGAAPI